MSYTLEQKREAANRDELWWRFPNELGAGDRKWTLCGICISADDAEYHIGPTPPRVLSELEGELLEALKGLDEAYCRCMEPLTRDERTEDRKRLIAARAAIQKAESIP